MKSSKDGIIGVVVGDAMGLPVQFLTREEVAKSPVTKMLGHGTFNMPEGSWSDDSSMTLATVDAIIEDGEINYETIAKNFVKWLEGNQYTPTGQAYDIGRTCYKAIINYKLNKCKAEEAGLRSEFDNGNGSLMRIMPVAYYCYAKNLTEENVYEIVKNVSSITHGHEIAIMGCFIYVLFAIALLKEKNMEEAYQIIKSINYKKYFKSETIDRFDKILQKNIKDYSKDEIRSTGFVLDTLEATLWALFNTDSYDSAILKVVNLGLDTDTIGACTGGLAGIYYGFDSINDEWKKKTIKIDWIIDMCGMFDEAIISKN